MLNLFLAAVVYRWMRPRCSITVFYRNSWSSASGPLVRVKDPLQEHRQKTFWRSSVKRSCMGTANGRSSKASGLKGSGFDRKQGVDRGTKTILLLLLLLLSSYLCSLLIYTLSPHSSRPPQKNRCVFSCKMRLAFILTVNLNTTDDPLASPMFSHVTRDQPLPDSVSFFN